MHSRCGCGKEHRSEECCCSVRLTVNHRVETTDHQFWEDSFSKMRRHSLKSRLRRSMAPTEMCKLPWEAPSEGGGGAERRKT